MNTCMSLLLWIDRREFVSINFRIAFFDHVPRDVQMEEIKLGEIANSPENWIRLKKCQPSQRDLGFLLKARRQISSTSFFPCRIQTVSLFEGISETTLETFSLSFFVEIQNGFNLISI